VHAAVLQRGGGWSYAAKTSLSLIRAMVSVTFLRDGIPIWKVKLKAIYMIRLRPTSLVKGFLGTSRGDQLVFDFIVLMDEEENSRHGSQQVGTVPLSQLSAGFGLFPLTLPRQGPHSFYGQNSICDEKSRK
jgi:hypothetical protein